MPAAQPDETSLARGRDQRVRAGRADDGGGSVGEIDFGPHWLPERRRFR